MTTPSAYSPHNPNLQLVWDATSLRALQFCPRYYKYGIVDGYRGSAVDLEFGILFASAIETYKKARLEGKSKQDATLLALRVVVENSWSKPDEHGDSYPWGGYYEEQWRCTGTEPYKNKAGNKAKCPWSHKGKWVPGDGPHTCGECGSDTESERRYVPGNNNKNRHTLVRLVGWYCEDQPEQMDAGFVPIHLASGKPAVELSFKLPLPFKTKQGEPFILAGYLDSIMEAGNERWIADNKTTKATLSAPYWKQFAPNVQVDTYDLAGSLLFPSENIKGVAIEAAQTLVGSAAFGLQLFRHDDTQREEFLNEIGWWLALAEKMAEDNFWPMNRANCKICPFNGVCSKPPARREEYLKADFEVSKWNPLEER
jgi:hypothetical protein